MSHPKYLPKRAFLALLALAIFVPVYLLSLVPGRNNGDSDKDDADAVSHEHVRRRIYLLGPTLLVPSAVALFLAIYLLGLVPSSSGESVAPVRIENIQVDRLPHATSPLIEVKVELENHDSEAHEIQAWWLLATPNAWEPWNPYAFQSTQARHTLAAGEKVELMWQEEIAAEPGIYELSAWVHTVEGDVTRHSDGKSLKDQTIRIDSQWSPFNRRAMPPPGLRVSAVDLTAPALEGGLSMPTELSLTIVITNHTAVETVADIQWLLYRRSSGLPWDGMPAYTSRQLRQQVFAPNRQTTITTGEPIYLWPGEYMLRVVAEAEGEGSVARDDLFLNDPITVLDNPNGVAIIRTGPALGPVEIAGLATDTGSFQRGKGSVMVTLRNRSESEQEVALWWFLSSPGTLQPWVEFDLQSKVFSAKIAPQQQSILDLSDGTSLPPGTYELSVWVHTVDSSGEQRPSDGGWFSRRVDIQ
jgi:hypothetical protein